MAGEIQRRVRIVYEIDGVEQAAEEQLDLASALERAGVALADQSREVDGLESRWDTANSAFRAGAEGAREATQAQMLLHQQTQALAGGLQGLSSIIGTQTEAGALVGRMGQFASVGIQLGSILGPQGAIVGGITGAVIPAFQAMLDALEAAEAEETRLTDTIDTQAAAYDDLLDSIRRVNAERSQGSILSMGLGSLEEQQAAVALQERTLQNLNETARALSAMEASEQNLRALTAVGQARQLTESRLAAAREALALAEGDLNADADDFIASGEMPGRASERQRRRGGGSRRRQAEDPIFGLARGRGQDDAIGFALGLGGDDRPTEFDIQLAGRQREGGPGSGLRAAAAERAQLQALDRLRDKQKEAHEEQMARIEEQVSAWTSAGERIGGVIASAFTTAIQGQEDFGVAVIKGFKSIAIEFGGQMIAEGVGALFTAIGSAVLNPPAAATKAAEGAGKIALGVSLGAAGAAIPVPSSGGQSKAPRLGPQGSAEGGGGSVVVNMNAPAVITGTRAETGRELERALRASRNRFGRAA